MNRSLRSERSSQNFYNRKIINMSKIIASTLEVFYDYLS